ncbi:hypothetical protein ACJ6WF_39955 [Streptomyces sp. MMS24-I2-30]|uniref:hypothetical protein n=1 Tax=Streptomyces sp. MMS24-I2-30 TaxID=3351564 RepID=UPI003896C76F
MNIGSYPSVSSTYLPSVRQELTAAYRGRTVNLSEGNAASLEEVAVSGTADLAFRLLLHRLALHTPASRAWRCAPSTRPGPSGT